MERPWGPEKGPEGLGDSPLLCSWQALVTNLAAVPQRIAMGGAGCGRARTAPWRFSEHMVICVHMHQHSKHCKGNERLNLWLLK